MNPDHSGQAAHYDALLAEHYSWMFGDDRSDAVAAQTVWLRRAGLERPGRSVDLGCGSGFQSEALLGLGATSLLAVDLSQPLLGELKAAVSDPRLRTVCADVLDFAAHVSHPVETAICMGDTLTHLASKSSVAALFGTMAGALSAGGRIVLSWRDLSTPPTGTARFIPLRSTSDRIMTCVLDDAGDRVRVTDIVHTRNAEDWTMRASDYHKLKLSRDWVRAQLQAVGFSVDFEVTERGLTVMGAYA